MSDQFLTQFRKQPRRDFADALYEQLAAQDEIPAQTVTRRPRRFLLSAFAAALLTVVFGTIMLTSRGGSPALTQIEPGILDNLTPITAQNVSQLTELTALGDSQPLGRGSVTDVAWSPDGNTLALSTSRGIWLQNVDWTRQPNLLPSDDLIRQVEFSPDGTLLAGNSDTVVHMWDLRTGVERLTLVDDTSMNFDDARAYYVPGTIAFSPDGTLLARANGVNVNVWDTSTGDLHYTLNSETNFQRSVAFSPHGTLLAAGGCLTVSERSGACLSGEIRYYDPAAGNLLNTFAANGVDRLTFTPDGTLLVATSFGGSIRIFDVPATLRGDVEPLFSRSENQPISDVALMPDGETLAVVGFSAAMRLWDLRSGEMIEFVEGLPGRDARISIRPQSDLLIASTDGVGSVQLYDWANRAPFSPFTDFNSSVDSVDVLPDARQIIASSYGKFSMWSVTGGLTARLASQYAPYGDGAAFSPDGARAAFITDDELVVLRDLTTGAEREITFENPDGRSDIQNIAFAADGSLLVQGAFEVVSTRSSNPQTRNDRFGAVVWRWTGEDDLEPDLLQIGTVMNGEVAFSSDGVQVALTNNDSGNIWLWNLSNGELRIAEGDGYVSHLAFAPDGDVLIAAHIPDGSTPHTVIQIIDTSNAAVMTSFDTPVFMHTMAYSADGALLALGGYDTPVYIRDMMTGMDYTLGTKAISLAFSADGRVLVTGSLDGLVRLWGIPAK